MPEDQTNHLQFVRAGIDATPLTFPPSGIRTYAEALLDQFANPAVGVEPVRIDPRASRTNRHLPGKSARLWWDLVAVGAHHPEDTDLLHVLHGSAPLRSSVPVVVTVHDLIPLTDPVYRQTRAMRVYQTFLERTLPRTEAMIVPSSYVASEAKRHWGLSGDRLHVIPMAISSDHVPAEDLQAVPPLLHQLGIHKPYVFNVGGFDERKNLPLLLEAFARFQREIETPHQLVIAGTPHTANERIYPPLAPVIALLGLEDQVVLTGSVPETTKIAIYQHAAMYVTPSRSEGFGLTCLEAMACGAPVIASNRTSLPEVTGDAAMLVETVAADIARAMTELATNPPLRDSLRTRGLIRAAQFSWPRTAAQTAAVYHSVLR